MMNNKQKNASGGKKKILLTVLIILVLLTGGALVCFGKLNANRKDYALQMQSEAKRFFDTMTSYQFSSTHPMHEDDQYQQLPDKDFSALCTADPEKLTVKPTDTSLEAFSLTWEEFGLSGSAPFGDAMYFVFRMENERVTQVIACERDILTEELLSRKPESNEVSLHDYFKKEYIAYYP